MNKNIILYPEIIASVLKNNESDIFYIWLIAKKIDTTNKGIISFKELLKIAEMTLGISSNHIYKKISKGTFKYWREPYIKNGVKFIALISLDKIIQRLSPEITRVKPVKIDINYFDSNFNNFKLIKNLFISIVAGRYTDNRPITIYSLMKNTGLSESTLINSLKNSPYLKKYQNYRIIQTNSNKNHLIDFLKRTTLSNCRIVENDSVFQILEQIGNTYELCDFERLPIKIRPKSLKINDRRMLDFIEQKGYNNLPIVSYLKK